MDKEDLQNLLEFVRKSNQIPGLYFQKQILMLKKQSRLGKNGGNNSLVRKEKMWIYNNGLKVQIDCNLIIALDTIRYNYNRKFRIRNNLDPDN